MPRNYQVTVIKKLTDLKNKDFENIYLYRIKRRKRYLDVASGYLTIFDFIYTTGQHFYHKCMMILVVSNYSKLSSKLPLGTLRVIGTVAL